MNLKSLKKGFEKLNLNDSFQFFGYSVDLQALYCSYFDEWSLIEVKDTGESVNQ